MLDTLKNARTGVSGILTTPFDAAGGIAPTRQKAIVDRAVAEGEHITGRFRWSRVSGVKAALAMMGNDCGAPLAATAWPLTQSQSDWIRGFMINQNFMKNG